MKESFEKFKFKPVAIVLIFVMFFQYLAMIIPFIQLESIAEISEEIYECEVNGITWMYQLDGDNAVNVYPKTKSEITGEIVIPDKLDNHNVTTIKANAFFYCSELTKLTIPNTVTKLESKAVYYCMNLEHVVLGIGLKEIGDAAFGACQNLEEIVFPESLEKIGSGAFSSCKKIQQITIPDGVTYLGAAFRNCFALKEVTLPGSLDTITSEIFTGCSALERIEIGNGVKTIENSAFENLTALKQVILPNSIINMGTGVFKDCTSLETLNLPSGITAIPDSTFNGCTSLSNIVISENITSIGANAFSGCTALASIYIPNSVTNINSNAFYNCTGLTNVTLPDEITTIGTSAFYGCSNLESINIPAGLTRIENKTFQSCSKLNNVVIPNNVTSIGQYAFYSCTELTSVVIPGNVLNIEDYAFGYCSKLVNIQLQDGVTTIGKNAFYKISKSTIIIPNSVTSIGENIVYKSNSSSQNSTVKCYRNSYAYTYAQENGYNCDILDDDDIEWYHDLNGMVRPANTNAVGEAVMFPSALYEENNTIIVKGVGEYAFQDCTSLRDFWFEQLSSVESIGQYAFLNCTNLENIILANSISKIDNGAFKGCSKLQTINISNMVNDIKKFVFDDCTSLTAINVSETNSNYCSENGILYNKDKTILIRYPQGKQETEFTIPDTVTKIADGAFYGCTNLTKINIPSSVTNIGEEAFNGCTSLTNMELTDNVTSIGKSAFSNCTNLTSINLPSNLTNISNRMFYNCLALSNVEFPEHLKTIEDEAFYNCTSLISVDLPQWLTKIGIRAFYNCTSLQYIVDRNTNKDTIGSNAFYNCNQLLIVCYKDSYIYDYAKTNNINYQILIQFEEQNLYTKMKQILANKNIQFGYDNPEELCFSMSEADIESIITLDLSHSEISSVVGLANFKNLEELDLSYNNFEDMPAVSGLKKMNLSHNHISEINSANVEELNLSYNEIENIESISYMFENVKKLILDNNKITTVGLITVMMTNDGCALEEVSVKNQNINKEVISNRYSLERIAPILKQAADELYSNGENVTYETANCTVDRGRVTISNEINNIDTFATITVHGGLMDGTVCTIIPDENVIVRYELSEDNSELKLNTFNITNQIEEQIYDIYLKYDLNNSEKFYEYSYKIPLKAGRNTIKVKFFGNTVIDEEINEDAPLNIDSIRKNGKVYIVSNADIKYSFEQNGTFSEYNSPIQDSQNYEKIYVKINNQEEIREILIKNTNVEDEKQYSTFDGISGNNNALLDNYAIRENGKIKITTDRTIQKYSYDNYIWFDYISERIDDLGTIKIYTKELDENNNEKIYEYIIVDENKLSRVLGSYVDNSNSYIFSQNRTNVVQDDSRMFIINDENKIEKYNKNIIGVTDFHDAFLILTDEQKVYRIAENNEAAEINGGTNIKQIDGVFAINNNNEILKCDYTGNGSEIEYSICSDYTFNKQIEKILSLITGGDITPLVMYEDGTVEVLQKTGINIEISKGAQDIASEREKIFVLENNKVRYVIDPCIYGKTYNDVINFSDLLSDGEIAIKINKYGMILTNLGKILNGVFNKREIKNYSENYIRKMYNFEGIKIDNSFEYILEGYSVFKENIDKLGNYSYQDKNNEIFYISRYEENSKTTDGFGYVYNYWYTFESFNANRTEDTRISVTKDESKLAENKVEIKLEFPENTYTVKLPNGEQVTNSTTYTVTENGVYTFEFTDEDGKSSIRVVHVTNIQNRKETKVPEVKVVDGKIKLESGNDVIKYSVDEMQTWNTYTEELTYSQPIYAKVENDEFECSTIKISIDENGKLDVTIAEDRKIQGQILTDALGASTYDEQKKIVEVSKTVAQIIANTQPEKEHSNFSKISRIVDHIIYSFSSTDGKYAGCYFEKTGITEMTYKDINGNIVSFENEKSINDILNDDQSKNIDYAIIKDNYIRVEKAKYNEYVQNGVEITDEVLDEIYENSAEGGSPDIFMTVKKQMKNYVYLDNTGNLYSNIGIIEKLKQHIGPNNCVKIVGDGTTFYVLTRLGEVYEITEDNNGTYGYFYKKINKYYDDYELPNIKADIVYKLEVNNIVDIYDNCTAKTKDGKIISLIECNEGESIVEKIQVQTDKYLIASHLGLKDDGKLYYYPETVAGEQVVWFYTEGENVEPGKIVTIENKQKAVGIFSKKQNTIRMFENYEYSDNYGELNEENEEYYFTVEKDEEKTLPKFIDIAEYRDSYLTNMQQTSPYNESWYVLQYFSSDYNAKAIAIAEDGEIYVFLIGNNEGYVVDTGMNLDFFGPTVNYSLSNSKWTNGNVTISLSANTRSEIVQSEIKKMATRRTLTSDGMNVQNINDTVEAQTNGTYNYSVTDAKGRIYTGFVNVDNIDKLKPITPEITEESGKLKVKFNDDQEATDEYGKSGIKVHQYKINDGEWQTSAENIKVLDVGKDDVVYAKSTDNAENESDIASSKLEEGTLRIKYLDEDENELLDDDVTIKAVGTPYNITAKEIDNYHVLEDKTVGDLQGTYTNGETTIIFYYAINKYTVTFYDEDGSTKLGESIVNYGTNASYEGEIPTKAATAQYTYTFSGWDDPEKLKNVTENRSVNAIYSKVVNKYTVTFYDEDGKTKLGESKVEYGANAIYKGTKPNKEESEQYTYTFDNWYTSTDETGVVDNLSNVIKDRNVYARYVKNAIIGKVIVLYQDIEGNELKESKTLSGEVGKGYKTEKIEIKGYEFKEVEGKEEGKFAKKDQTVIYKYSKIKESKPEPKPQAEIGKVIVKYEDINGKKLAENKTLSGEVGKGYKTEKIEISGYEFKEVVGKEEGKFAKEEQTVIYKYKEILAPKPEQGKVIVKYQDENGNSIKDDVILKGEVGKAYKTEKAEFEVYEFVEVEGKEEGKFAKEEQVVIYKYNKKSGRVIIIYNDPDGVKIKENDVITGKIDSGYKVKRQVVDGYELVEVIGNEEGKYTLADQFVLYKYKKLEVPTKIPQTGQSRMEYLVIGIVIIISICGLIYIKWDDLNHKK